MAIKAGSIITLGNKAVIVDRLQTVGPGNVNVPRETVYEVGNYQSVGQIFDTPQLSFTLDSFDVSCEIEALLLDVDLASTSSFDLSSSKPVDIASEILAGKQAASPFDTVDSVGIPYLALEQMSYRFGLKQNAAQQATLRGDSIYYNPGSVYIEEFTGTNAANQVCSFAHVAYGVTEAGVKRHELCVTAGGKRLVLGSDYSESAPSGTGAVTTTITVFDPVAVTDKIRVMYASSVVAQFLQNVHEDVSVKPAAIRGRDIQVYLGGYSAGAPATNRLPSVQAVNVDWRVTLQQDEEFGNYHYVDQDFDVPTVSGSIQFKPVNPAELLKRMQQLAGVTDATQSAPATASPAIELDVVLHDPVTGAVLKRLHVPDARFTLPGYSARVQQKLDITAQFASDAGSLTVSKT